MQQINSTISDIRKILETFVIKFDTKARDSEVSGTQRAIDMYMSARQMRDSFHTYPSFEYQAIVNAGITTNPSLIEQYMNNKYTIPVAARESVVKAQRKLIIDNYVEQNNYYRELMGLPNTNDMDFIYLDPEVAATLGLDPTKPIHLYNSEEIYMLQTSEFFKPILENNPTKKYLNFLGSNSIDVVTARNARNFSILRITGDIPDSFYEEFINVYEQCREYTMVVLYNKDIGRNYKYYENFMAMFIMVMTIQRIIVNMFKYGIEYDFYDISSIKLIFDAYNIPFTEALPIDYQRLIIRNLNNLLRHKSTDKVLYDILSILGLDRVKLYKYFLIKQHKLDDNGNPIFAYKEEDDGQGGTVTVPDYPEMFELFFQSVELNEKNISLALADNTNTLDYSQIVGEDPYWWDEDENLKQAIYETEFNYIESKYLGMNIMYKLTEMLFEVSYFFNMLIDKKNRTDTYTISIPRLSADKDYTLFEVAIIISAMVARKNRFAGNIIHTPTKAMNILGFNFNQSMQTLRENIRKNPHLDNELIQFLTSTSLSSPDDVNQLFVDIRDMNDYIINKMATTNDKDVYHAYRNLYDTMMVTQHMENLFKKSNGEIATTFIEYLYDIDPVTANFIDNEIEYDSLGEYTEHILYRLNMFANSLQYLHIITDSDSLVMSTAMTLIRFFKSYTTDLTSFNVLYILDSKYYNMIRLIHHIQSVSKTNEYSDRGLSIKYNDLLAYSSTFTEKDWLEINELYNYTVNIHDKDKFTFIRDSVKTETKLNPEIILKFKHLLELTLNMFVKDAEVTLKDDRYITTTLNQLEIIRFIDAGHLDIVNKLSTQDIISLITMLDSVVVNAKLNDSLIEMDEDFYMVALINRVNELRLTGLIGIFNEFTFYEVLSLNDTITKVVTSMEFRDDGITFKDLASILTNQNKSDEMSLKEDVNYHGRIHSRDDIKLSYGDGLQDFTADMSSRSTVNMRDKLLIRWDS